MITIGLQGLLYVGSDTDWDPKFGPSTVEIYTGLEADVKTAAAQFNKAGFRATTHGFQGPEHQLRVYFPDGRDGRKIFVETWERVTEWASVDVRNNPKIIALAGTSDTLVRWIFEIKKQIREGKALTGTVDPGQQKIYDLYARGVEAYEVKRFVLRRRRTFPPKDAAGLKMDPIEKIWPTQLMVSFWGVPPIISTRLPADPGAAYTPSDTRWGWRARVDETRDVLARNAGRTDEVLDFVYAAWSTLLYDVATV